MSALGEDCSFAECHDLALKNALLLLSTSCELFFQQNFLNWGAGLN